MPPATTAPCPTSTAPSAATMAAARAASRRSASEGAARVSTPAGARTSLRISCGARTSNPSASKMPATIRSVESSPAASPRITCGASRSMVRSNPSGRSFGRTIPPAKVTWPQPAARRSAKSRPGFSNFAATTGCPGSQSSATPSKTTTR